MKSEHDIKKNLGPHKADFRVFLQETLVQRCKNNPAYSLRAFAKQLHLEPSYLSKILSGKRGPSPETIKKISARLNLGPQDVKPYLKEKLSKKNETDQAFENLTIDHFNMIADWYHYAILELISVKGFKSDAAWIAKKLNIKKIEVQAAIERLLRLEMIEEDKNGNYQNASGNNTTTSNDFTSAALRKLQKQILQQAIDAMENISFEYRDQGSMTMAIDPALLPEAKNKIKEFRRELCAFLQNNGRPKKEVYQFSTSFFPITNKEIN